LQAESKHLEIVEDGSELIFLDTKRKIADKAAATDDSDSVSG
jgi:hypothetical protein